jgi:hypothetical protein
MPHTVHLMKAVSNILECGFQPGRHLPSAVKETLRRNVRFVDAGDLVDFGLADTIAVQHRIEDEVLPREHIAAHAKSEKATNGNISEGEATARYLPVQNLDGANPPSLRVKDGRAAVLTILDKSTR